MSFLGKKPFTLFECFTLDSFKVGSGLVRVDAKVEPIFVFIFIFGFVFVFIGSKFSLPDGVEVPPVFVFAFVIVLAFVFLFVGK